MTVRDGTAAPLDGNAIVYCEGAFASTNGKTAHGLVRRTRRYRVLSVVDSALAGKDAGQVLDGKPDGIPIVGSIADAVAAARAAGTPATHLVVGLAPDGGRLSPRNREDIRAAVEAGLNVDCGLHDFLTEDPELVALAARRGVTLRDVRKPAPRSELHFFTGKIEEVAALKIAVLGTDSAVGKRTTAWVLVDEFDRRGIPAELVGTGQTAWLQGARYTLLLDSVVSDFMSGEIEHAVWAAWKEGGAKVILIEGQGSIMNPAYPGGYEILAAGRPDCIVLQHSPTRKEYDGFPGYPLHPVAKQIQVLEMVSEKPVVAVTLNHEGLPDDRIRAACQAIARETGLPCVDVLKDGPAGVVDAILARSKTGLARNPKGAQ
jgi:uncharacterized NAD-dependent epimerase/dehydratase family protein